MIGFAAERLMELEVGAATGAGYGEKPVAHGPAQRLSRARLGDARRHRRAELRIPKLRKGSYFPGFF
ncbi:MULTISPECIES: hypothetical protein [unclassified Mesorhizobium]|uniref:hypothetical protein n=1 Tax=Mesorhizobium muleiense TaxID=1004279 RepID=UPI000489712C|nr:MULTISPECIES: hypothetical protein [unclassified Mesorhizobium]